MSMDSGHVREKIARIEADLEEFAVSLDRCRKAMLLAKVAIAAGALWMIAALVGAISFDSTPAVGAIGAIIGGIVVYGSNSSTSKQTLEAMKAAERRRSDLIDIISPKAVRLNGE